MMEEKVTIETNKKELAAKFGSFIDLLNDATKGMEMELGHGHEEAGETEAIETGKRNYIMRWAEMILRVESNVVGTIELAEKYLSESFPEYRKLRHVPKVWEEFEALKKAAEENDSENFAQARFRLLKQKNQLYGFLRGMEQVDEEYRTTP